MGCRYLVGCGNFRSYDQVLINSIIRYLFRRGRVRAETGFLGGYLDLKSDREQNMRMLILFVSTLAFLNSAVYVAAEETAKSYYSSAAQKHIKEDFDGAIADYTKAIELDPNYVAAYANRAIAKSAQGDHGGALEDFSTAEQIDPNSVVVLYSRAGMRFGQGDYDGAIADFSKVISLKPGESQFYHGRAAARISRGEFDEAIQDFTTAIELAKDPQVAAATLRDRGTAKIKKGDPDGAIADWEKAIESDPTLKADLDLKIQRAREN